MTSRKVPIRKMSREVSRNREAIEKDRQEKVPPEVLRQRKANAAARTTGIRAAIEAAKAIVAAEIEADRAEPVLSPEEEPVLSPEERRTIRSLVGRIASERDPVRQQKLQAEFDSEFKKPHPAYFLPREAKARIFLEGRIPADEQRMPLPRQYLEKGSLWEWDCQWALTELCDAGALSEDLQRLLGSLVAPDGEHPLAGERVIAFRYRQRRRPPNTFRTEAIAAEIEDGIQTGEKAEAVVARIAERLERGERQIRRSRAVRDPAGKRKITKGKRVKTKKNKRKSKVDT